MVIAGRVRKDPPRDLRDCASPTLSNSTFNVPQSAYASVLAIASLDGVTGLCQVRGALGSCFVVVPRCDGVN